MGGSANLIEARQRQALDAVASDNAVFDLPPLDAAGVGALRLLAVQQQMPLHGVVGRKPYIRGGVVMGFASDPAFVLTESLRTQELPGAITDVVIEEQVSGSKKHLFVLLQENAGAFDLPQRSQILAFDLE